MGSRAHGVEEDVRVVCTVERGKACHVERHEVRTKHLLRRPEFPAEAPVLVTVQEKNASAGRRSGGTQPAVAL